MGGPKGGPRGPKSAPRGAKGGQGGTKGAQGGDQGVAREGQGGSEAAPCAKTLHLCSRMDGQGEDGMRAVGRSAAQSGAVGLHGVAPEGSLET